MYADISLAKHMAVKLHFFKKVITTESNFVSVKWTEGEILSLWTLLALASWNAAWSVRNQLISKTETLKVLCKFPIFRQSKRLTQRPKYRKGKGKGGEN